MQEPHILDRVEQTLTKLTFLNSMFGAWDVEQIPLCVEDLAGIQLFMDDIIEEVRGYGKALSEASSPNTP